MSVRQYLICKVVAREIMLFIWKPRGRSIMISNGCSNVDYTSVCSLQVCRQPLCLCGLFSSAAYIIIKTYMHINIYIQRLFCPQRLHKRCSREKTTRVTSALWGYRFTALHVTGVLLDVISSFASWLLFLLLIEEKIFSKLTRLFLENSLVSWWFVTHDPFWRPSRITTSIIQHKIHIYK